MANKDLLFYSNYCDYSKEIIALITKKNLKNTLLVVCIDHGKYNIPSCITCVPSLLTVTGQNRRVYTENGLREYLEEKAKALYPQEQSTQTFSWERNNYSESYSFVDNDVNNNGHMTAKAYTMLEDQHESFAKQFKDEEDNKLKQAKFDAARYDAYLASRKSDEEHINKSMQGNNINRI